MKKVLIVTKVDNYRPDLCEFTIPNLKAYASRIGADFFEIEHRKFSNQHPAFEKLQAYECMGAYDKALLIDADIMLHPKLPDLTGSFSLAECGSWMNYQIKAPQLTLWNIDNDPYFQRDGRNLGVVGSIVGCSKYTKDIFKPSFSVPTDLYRPEIIDEYVMSRNVAKFGLKHVGLWALYEGIFHAEATTKNEKDVLEKARQISKEWKSA